MGGALLTAAQVGGGRTPQTPREQEAGRLASEAGVLPPIQGRHHRLPASVSTRQAAMLVAAPVAKGLPAPLSMARICWPLGWRWLAVSRRPSPGGRRPPAPPFALPVPCVVASAAGTRLTASQRRGLRSNPKGSPAPGRNIFSRQGWSASPKRGASPPALPLGLRPVGRPSGRPPVRPKKRGATAPTLPHRPGRKRPRPTRRPSRRY
jgi:hypothetical protein